MTEKVCKRPSCGKPRYPGKKWCSIACAAPSERKMGGGVTARAIPSTVSAASSTKAPGATLPPRSLARPSELSAIGNAGGLTRGFAEESRVMRALAAPERMHESAKPIEPSLPPSEPPSIESETSEECEIQSGESDSEATTTQPAAAASREFTPTETAETRHESSTGPLLTLEQESYVQTSLVDQSIERLHLQMKRLTFDPRSAKVYEVPVDCDDKSEIIRAKLACATATSMARLLKTKLDAARMFTT